MKNKLYILAVFVTLAAGSPGINVNAQTAKSKGVTQHPNKVARTSSTRKEVVKIDPCFRWQTQVLPKYVPQAININKLTGSETIAGIGCLLQLKGNRNTSPLNGDTRDNPSRSTGYKPPKHPATVEIAALYYVSYLFTGNWEHADEVTLIYTDSEDFDNVNTPEIAEKAYSAYEAWFTTVKQMGLKKARLKFLDPLEESGISWNGSRFGPAPGTSGGNNVDLSGSGQAGHSNIASRPDLSKLSVDCRENDRIRLRIYNRSGEAIAVPTFSFYVNPAEIKQIKLMQGLSVFPLPNNKDISTLFYFVKRIVNREKSINVVESHGGDSSNISWIPSDDSIFFSVPSQQLTDDSEIFVKYNYERELSEKGFFPASVGEHRLSYRGLDLGSLDEIPTCETLRTPDPSPGLPQNSKTSIEITEPELKGHIEDLKIEKIPSGYNLIARIKFELKNTGDRPLILLKELKGNRAPTYVGAEISPVGTRNTIVEDFFGESPGLSPRWQEFKKQLNTPAPSPDKFQVVMPGKPMVFEDTIQIELPDEASKRGYFPKRASFEEIDALRHVSLRLIYRTWSANLDMSQTTGKEDPTFLASLRERWKSYGYLWRNAVISEPIIIDVSSANSASAKK